MFVALHLDNMHVPLLMSTHFNSGLGVELILCGRVVLSLRAHGLGFKNYYERCQIFLKKAVRTIESTYDAKLEIVVDLLCFS